MSDFVDYYELLGVAPDASAEAITKAYKEKISVAHPDKNDNASWAVEESKKLNAARDTLVDAGKRRAYDAHLHVWRQRNRRAPFPAQPRPHHARPWQGPPPRSAEPRPRSGLGWGWLAVGFGVAGVAVASANRYDANVDRYRARNGEFRRSLFW